MKQYNGVKNYKIPAVKAKYGSTYEQVILLRSFENVIIPAGIANNVLMKYIPISKMNILIKAAKQGKKVTIIHFITKKVQNVDEVYNGLQYKVSNPRTSRCFLVSKKQNTL